MVVDHTSTKAFALSRFFTTTWTGAFGHGNRSDSWKDRWMPCFGSAVVSHSP